MGIYFLTVGAGHRPSEVLYDRADSAFALAAAESVDWGPILANASWLHVSGITPALGKNAAAAALRAARAAARRDGLFHLIAIIARSCGSVGTAMRERFARAAGGGRPGVRRRAGYGLDPGRGLSKPAGGERFQASAADALAMFPHLKRVATTVRLNAAWMTTIWRPSS